jgi:REP element-mobilizing transposase RayT
MPAPERKSPRIQEYDYATAGAYLTTICARRRACLFGAVVDDRVLLNTGELVARAWAEIPSHFDGVDLDEFVVMPNHLHGIVWLSRAGHCPAPTCRDRGRSKRRHRGPPVALSGSARFTITSFVAKAICRRSVGMSSRTR